MWRFTRSSGITEGFHRKMKLIQRVAYGFRNFENHRLRVIALSGRLANTETWKWYARRGSNPQPSAPETDALSN